MLLFVFKRLLAAFASIFLAAVFVFVALLAVPGDPAEIILGINASPQTLQALREQMGLTLPPAERFAAWFGGLLRGDLGLSTNYGQPVTALIASRLEVSLPLAFGAMLLACLIALPLGILAALRQGGWLDLLVTSATQAGAAIPSFWLGLLLILLFSVELGWLPAGGWTSWSADPARALRSLVLPVLALGLGQAAVITRQTRAAMLEVLGQDYIRTARAKGLRARRVIYGHALKNALVTLVTILGLSLSQLLVGAIVIEQVFALPGLGRLALTAIGTRDFPLLQGEVLFYATIIVSLNFLVDVSYSVLDPRIRYG